MYIHVIRKLFIHGAAILFPDAGRPQTSGASNFLPELRSKIIAEVVILVFPHMFFAQILPSLRNPLFLPLASFSSFTNRSAYFTLGGTVTTWA